MQQPTEKPLKAKNEIMNINKLQSIELARAHCSVHKIEPTAILMKLES